MEREDRYLVIKKEDIIEHLDPDEKEQLIHLEECIASRKHCSQNKNKPPTRYVVVGHDWPMYEAVWQMIEDWVDKGEANGYEPQTGDWYYARDIDSMVRALDRMMNGHDAAKQARLCDIFHQLESHIATAKKSVPCEMLPTLKELDEELPWDLQLAGLFEKVADDCHQVYDELMPTPPSEVLQRMANAIYEAAGLQDPPEQYATNGVKETVEAIRAINEAGRAMLRNSHFQDDDRLVDREVMVYDRYRFAIPATGIIREVSTVNDGVRVELTESNSCVKYPIGSDIWVHLHQCQPIEDYVEWGDTGSGHFANEQLIAHSEPDDKDVYTTQDDLFRIRLANAITKGAELGKLAKCVDLYQSDGDTARHVTITYDDGTESTLFGQIANDFFTTTTGTKV